MLLCCLVMMLSKYEVFPEGYISGNYNMKIRVSNGFSEECSSFLQFFIMMACHFEYNIYVMWIFYYHIFNSSVAQMMKLVATVC